MTDTTNEVAPEIGFRFEPALNGLRTLAVAAVVAYHSAPYLTGRGGFIGVDIFFVLSGFLITSLLLVERQRQQKIGLRRFWGRRARRLLPALGVALCLLALLALRSQSVRASHIRLDTISTLFYVQNWRNAFPIQTGSLSALAHTWSLSVEEQWYLVWPLVLAALLRWTHFRVQRIAIAVGACAVASSLWMAHLYEPGAASRAYFGTDTRAQALLIGASFALLTFSRRDSVPTKLQPRLEIAAWIGLCFIAAMVIYARPGAAFTYRGGVFLVAIAAGFIVLAAMESHGPMRKVLSLRLLTTIGPWTYGIYLFQPLVYDFVLSVPAFRDRWIAFGVECAITTALAAASYRWIEMPLRNGERSAKSIGFRLGIALSFSAAIGVIFSVGAPKPPPLINAAAIAALHQRAAEAPVSAKKVLLLGEWRTFTVSMVHQNQWQANGITGVAFGLFGCGISDGDILLRGSTLQRGAGCDRWPDAFQQAITAFHPSVVALSLGEDAIFTRLIGSDPVFVGSPEWKVGLGHKLEAIQTMAARAGARLVIVTNECVPQTAALPPLRAMIHDAQRYQTVGAALRRYATSHGLSAYDFSSTLCPGNRPVLNENRSTRFDGKSGFTEAGAALLWKWLAPLVR